MWNRGPPWAADELTNCSRRGSPAPGRGVLLRPARAGSSPMEERPPACRRNWGRLESSSAGGPEQAPGRGRKITAPLCGGEAGSGQIKDGREIDQGTSLACAGRTAAARRAAGALAIRPLGVGIQGLGREREGRERELSDKFVAGAGVGPHRDLWINSVDVRCQRDSAEGCQRDVGSARAPLPEDWPGKKQAKREQQRGVTLTHDTTLCPEGSNRRAVAPVVFQTFDNLALHIRCQIGLARGPLSLHAAQTFKL